MLLPRHRPDKENQVHRLPKTPGPAKSIIHKVPPKTPFNDENYLLPRTGKKSVVFGQSTTNLDHSKFDAFQTPGTPYFLLRKANNSSSTRTWWKGLEYETDSVSCASVNHQALQ